MYPFGQGMMYEAAEVRRCLKEGEYSVFTVSFTPPCTGRYVNSSMCSSFSSVVLVSPLGVLVSLSSLTCTFW